MFDLSSLSKEITAKLRLYDELLHKWQKSINLVSRKSLPDSWNRHFIDSLQLLSYLPNPVNNRPCRIVDIGSGAGFPGLVLAIANPGLQICLIESDHKKCEFMRYVSRETKAINIDIVAERIENFAANKPENNNFDVMTARALDDLTGLLMYAEMLNVKKAVFLKGERYKEEIEKATQTHKFNVETHVSMTDQKARILVIDRF